MKTEGEYVEQCGSCLLAALMLSVPLMNVSEVELLLHKMLV